MNNKYLIILSGLLILFSLGACATTQNIPVENRTKVFNNQYETTFRAIVQTLSDEGFAISTADSETGIINTDYSNVSTMKAILTGDERTKINAIVNGSENSTQVRLNISIQKKAALTGWQSASMTENQAIEYYEEMFNKIEANL